MPRNPDCQRCPLHEGVKNRCIWGQGNPNAEIMLIGEAPGEVEDQTGLPFQGPAGRVLDQALTQAGLRREDVFVTNIAKCRPPNNRTPVQNEVRACFPNLVEEINTVHPKIVLALGGSAINLLTGRESVSRSRGALLTPAKHVRLNGSKLMGSYHPAAYLNSKRNPTFLQGLIEDLKLAARMTAPRAVGEGVPPNITTILAPGYDAATLDGALHELDSAPYVAIDCEWTYVPGRRGVAWPWTRGAELYSIAVAGRTGDELHTVAFACPLDADGTEVLRSWLRGRKVIFHNAMADLTWLYGLRLPVTLAGDTMLLAHLLNETAELKLATLAQTWVGVENWKNKETQLYRQRPRSQEAWENLLDYNATDSGVTVLLYEKLVEAVRKMPEGERTDLWRLYKHLTLPSVPMFVRMALQGMPLSAQKVDAAIVEQNERMLGYATELGNQTGRKPEQAIDLALSPAQVKEVLRAQFGIEVDATDDTVMNELAEQYPICHVIQQVKHCGKLLGTYLRPWSELLEEQGDGRLHSVYSITATVTGRTSAQAEKGASVQLVPRQRSAFGDEAWIRALFEAPEGYKILSIDESALEMRIAAAVAPEHGLRDRFMAGIDPHTYTASKFVGVPMEDTAYWKSPDGKEARQKAKVPNFGQLYGLQPEGLRTKAKKDYGIEWTLEEAQQIRGWWLELHPDFPSWWRRGEAQFQKGYVRTITGRVRRYLQDSNKVPNTEVQGPATEIVMLALIELDRWLESRPDLDTVLVAFVHDDGKLLVPEWAEAEVATKALEIFRNPPVWKLGITDLGVPLDAEIKSGRCWE